MKKDNDADILEAALDRSCDVQAFGSFMPITNQIRYIDEPKRDRRDGPGGEGSNE